MNTTATTPRYKLTPRRALWFVVGVAALSLLLGSLLLRVPAPQTDTGYVLRTVVHALLEWTSVGLGLAVAALAILYWWVFGRALLPAMVGAVFGLSGLLDGLQGGLTEHLWAAPGISAEQATTVIVRVFTASGYVLLACCGRQRRGGSASLRPVWLVDTLFVVTVCLMLGVSHGALSVDSGLWTLLAYLPAVLFVVALLVGARHQRSGAVPPPVALALVASLVPQLTAEFSTVFSSSAEDSHMLAAHGLKLLSTGLVVLALAYRLGQRQRALMADTARLAQAHKKLDRQNSNLERAQQHLAHQKEQLDMALAAGGTGSFVWHVEEDALVLDEHLRQKLGLHSTGPGCLSRGAFAGLVHLEDQQAFATAVERGLRGEAPLRSRFRIAGPEGEITLTCAGTVHRDPSGEPIKVVGVLTDVTQQAKAEREREQVEARIRRFLDAMPLGVFVEDTEGNTYYANDRARELLGRERSMHPETAFSDVPDLRDADDASDEASDEASGDATDLTLMGHISGGVPGAQVAGVVGRNNAERLPLVRAYGGEESVEEVEVESKGQKHIVRMWGAPIFGEDERVEFAMAVMQDITDIKQLELERAQGQKLEAIGQLAAGIAHEINTPTQYVSDNTHFMETAFKRLDPFLDAAEAIVAAKKQGEVTEALFADLKKTARKAKLDFVRREVPKAIEQSLEGLERVATIVRAMKEFSHPGGGGMSPTDLNRAVQTTVTVARNEWKYVAEVEFDLAEDLPNVPALPDELNQVILNIVVNAAHAIREKLGERSAEKGHISIATRLADDHAEIIISDDGTGVPQAIQERVFDPFFTTKPVGKGTGQGLAIARKVMLDGHHGDLKLTSQEGEGATFTLILPLEQPDTAEGTEEAAQ